MTDCKHVWKRDKSLWGTELLRNPWVVCLKCGETRLEDGY